MMLRLLPSRLEAGMLATLTLACWAAQRWLVGSTPDAPRLSHNPLSISVTLIGLLLVLRPLRDVASRPASMLALGICLIASPIRPLLSGVAAPAEAVTFCLCALILRIWWDRRDRMDLWTALFLGAMIGLATAVRVENLGLMILPLGKSWTEARSWREGARHSGLALGSLACVLAVVARLGLDPAASLSSRIDLYGVVVLWLSSNRGLLYWHPILWFGIAGLALLTRRNVRSMWPLTALLVSLSLFISLSATNHEVDSAALHGGLIGLLPLLTVGLARCVQAGVETVRARPELALFFVAASAALWNFLFMEQYRRFMIPRDDTVAFAAVAANSASLVSHGVGCPLSWPANWWLSWRYGVPLATADRLLGHRLLKGAFGVVDLGDERVDSVLLQEGWSRSLACEDAVCREVRGRARILVPLERRERLDIIVRASGAGTLSLDVNDRPLLQWPLSDELTDTRVTATTLHWETPISQLSFEVSPSGTARVDSLLFLRNTRKSP